MIWFLGDVHGHFQHIEDALDAAAVKPSTVIFLGDIEAPIPFEHCIEGLVRQGIAVHWIRGNHDTDSEENWRNLFGIATMARNIDGKVIEVDGLRIAGLGGIFRAEVWHRDIDNGKPSHASYIQYEKALRRSRPRNQKVSPIDLVRMQQSMAGHQDNYLAGKLLKHKSTIFPDVYERLADQKADILVTHEAPSCHPNGFAAIDLLAQVMGVTAVFHGHHHDCLDYSRQWPALGFKAYGVGFCGITDQDGNVIAAGDFDEARRYRQQHVPPARSDGDSDG